MHSNIDGNIQKKIDYNFFTFPCPNVLVDDFLPRNTPLCPSQPPLNPHPRPEDYIRELDHHPSAPEGCDPTEPTEASGFSGQKSE